jgi:hypothetical protein
MVYKSLSTNVIPMSGDELDCISPCMVLDAFKFSFLGIFYYFSKYFFYFSQTVARTLGSPLEVH